MNNDMDSGESQEDFDPYELAEEIEISLPEQPADNIAKTIDNLQQTIEQLRNNIEDLQVQQKDIGETASIPFWLIAHCFKFKMGEYGLELENVNRYQWDAIRLYALLLYKAKEIGNRRMPVSINFLTKGLGIRKENLHIAIDILKRAKLVKTRMEGQKLCALKHYVTML